MDLKFTRAMVRAALDGSLAESQFDSDPVFGVGIPQSCPGAPAELLHPANTWADKNAYEQKSRQLARLFTENFRRFGDAPAEIAAAGPAN
jgi:phosphoenolpyruvate carboxykinase (ATP)